MEFSSSCNENHFNEDIINIEYKNKDERKVRSKILKLRLKVFLIFIVILLIIVLIALSIYLIVKTR